MSKFNLDNKRIWLTGASSGIGAEIAKQLLQSPCKLIVSGRNIKALEAIADSSPYHKPLVVAFDINDKAAHALAVDTIREHYGGLDLVIFNAGTCDFYDPQNFSSQVFENLINTNFLSVVYGLEAVLPLLRESSNAMIVAVSSIAAYDGLPFGMGAYSASKAALSILLKSLSIELHQEKIHTLLVSPGFVDTPLAKKNPFFKPFLISPQKAATNIIRAINKKKLISSFPKLVSITFRNAHRLPRPLLMYLLNVWKNFH